MNISNIEKIIYFIRDQKVMLDADLARLYGVKTKRLKEQVKRNHERFPSDFMFELTVEEFKNLRLSRGELGEEYGGGRRLPFAFTENGVAMLSSILHTPEAIQVNIAIMRIFTKLRSFLLLEQKLSSRVEKLEEGTNKMFKTVFERLDDIDERIDVKIPDQKKRIGIK